LAQQTVTAMGDPSLEACSLEADQAGCFIGPGLWLLAASIALVKKTGSSSDAQSCRCAHA